MQKNSIIWVPYGKENAFEKNYTQLEMGSSERQDWLGQQAEVTNGEVSDTIYSNHALGYAEGVGAAMRFVGLSVVVGSLIYMGYRYYKNNQKKVKGKSTTK